MNYGSNSDQNGEMGGQNDGVGQGQNGGVGHDQNGGMRAPEAASRQALQEARAQIEELRSEKDELRERLDEVESAARRLEVAVRSLCRNAKHQGIGKSFSDPGSVFDESSGDGDGARIEKDGVVFEPVDE